MQTIVVTFRQSSEKRNKYAILHFDDLDLSTPKLYLELTRLYGDEWTNTYLGDTDEAAKERAQVNTYNLQLIGTHEIETGNVYD